MDHAPHSKRKPSDTTATWTPQTTESAAPIHTPSSPTPSQPEQSAEAERNTQESIYSLHHFGNVSLFAPEPEATPATPPNGGDGFGNQTGGASLIQASLRVNAPDDAFEQEADSVADMVMRSPATSDNLDTTPTDPIAALHVQRTADEGAGLSASPAVEANIAQMQSGGGSPIPAADRSFFEQRMGHDFSQIRIHTDSRAVETSQSLNARAFTVGTDIAFDAGEYQPGTESGRHLLAHELTHTIQQTGSVATKRVQRQVADEEVEEAVAEPEEVSSPENAAAEAIASFNPADAEREREEPIEGEEATLAGEEPDAVDTSGGSEPNVSAPSGGTGTPASEGAVAQASAPPAGALGAILATSESAAQAGKGVAGGALEQAQKAAQDALAVAQQGAAQAANQAQAKGGTAEQTSQPTTDSAHTTTAQANSTQAGSAQPDTANAEAAQTEHARAEGVKPETK